MAEPEPQPKPLPDPVPDRAPSQCDHPMRYLTNAQTHWRCVFCLTEHPDAERQ